MTRGSPAGTAARLRRGPHRRAALAIAVACASSLAASGGMRAAEPPSDPRKAIFRILFTGETHSVLFPCDCPMAKMGGAARRASVVKSYRKFGDVLLLDTGGWAAGGIYDPETAGDKLDRLRSACSMRIMALMGYDASAVGDEEMDPALLTALDGGDLKAPAFLASNWKCPGYDARKILRRTYGDLKVAVFGLTTGEAKILWRERPEAHIAVGDPAAAAREALAEIQRTGGADIVILLSHLGETESERLVKEVPGIHLALVGHRKATHRIHYQVNDTELVNFDFQARRMMIVQVLPPPAGSPAKFRFEVAPEPIFGTVEEDAEVRKVLAELKSQLEQGQAKQRIEIEIFRMPFCPHCRLLEREIRDIEGKLAGRVRIKLHYVVSRDEKGNFHSLRGPKEVEESEIQLLIAKYYPDGFWEYLKWRAENSTLPWEEGAKSLGFLMARLRGARALGEGRELLNEEAVLAERRQVAGAPTIFIQNRLYSGQIERLRILREICAALAQPKPSECNTVPSCFTDRDCYKKGFVGVCANAGQPNAACILHPAVPVHGAVVRDFKAAYTNHEQIVESLYAFLPGLQPRDVDVNSEEGRGLAEKYSIERLPAYVLTTDAEKEKSFFDIQNGCKRVKDRFVFSGTGIVGSHQVLARKRIPGRADLFVAPFSRTGGEAIASCMEYMKELRKPPDLRFHYVLYLTDGKELAAQGGLAEVQEAARALAIRLKHPDKFVPYIVRRNERRGDAFWDVPIEDIGLDPAEIRAMSEDNPARGRKLDPAVRRAMEEEAQILKEIDAGGDLVLLGENCEVLPVPNRRMLRDHLEIIGRRRPE